MKLKKFLKISLLSIVGLISTSFLSSCNTKSFNSYELCSGINDIISEFTKSGKKEEIKDKWFNLDEEGKTFDFASLTGLNGTLNIGISSGDEPFAYVYEGQWTGLCFEYIYELCVRNNYTVNMHPYSSMTSLITAVSTGKADIAIGAVSITEERMQTVSYSNPFFDNTVICIVRESENSINSSEDLIGKKVGVLSETTVDKIVENDCKEAEIKRYNSYTDSVIALENGQVDAVYLDEAIYRFISLSHTSLKIAYTVASNDQYGFVFQKFGYQCKSELKGKNIGILEGSIYRDLCEEAVENVKTSEYKDTSSLVLALQNKKIDSFVIDKSLLNEAAKENQSLYTLNEPLTCVDTGAAFPKTDEGLLRKNDFDDFINEIRNTGKLAELVNKWENYEYGVTKIENIPDSTGSSEIIYVSINALISPYAFVEDNQYTGLDIELIKMYCFERNISYRLENMDFAALIPSLAKNDMAISCMSITPARAESVYFSNPLYASDIVFAVMANSQNRGSFFKKIANSFEKTFIKEGRWKLFTEGTGITLLITVISIVVGLLLGFSLYLLVDRTGKIAEKIMKVYTSLMHNLPVVVVLMIFYYIIFGKSSLSGVFVSCVVFSLLFSASTYSMITTCVKAIDKGQYDAAKSLGYSRNKTFFKIVLPQTFQQFLPLLRDQIVALLKATAIVGYVAVEDLTKMSDIVRSRTYESFFPLIVTAIIYFLLAMLLIHIVDKITLSIDPKKRTKKKILKGVVEHD